jgi:hypothetical protein
MDLNTFSLKDCTSHIGSRVMVKRWDVTKKKTYR